MRSMLIVPLMLLSLTAAALAADTRVGQVVVHDPWARASLGAMRTSAAYMTIEVTGDRADRLIAAASPIAEHAQLHAEVMEQGIAKMRPVAAVEIAPGTPTVLAPGGLHLMLTGLRNKLVEGQTMPLELTFENAGKVELEVPVRGMAGGSDHGMDHGMDHGAHGQGQPGKMMTN
jgi:periplasmic copper chaperone A